MSECNVNQLSSDAACFTCLDPKTRDGIQTELLCQILTAIGGGGETCVTQCTDPWIVSGTVALDAATLAALETVNVIQSGTWTNRVEGTTLDGAATPTRPVLVGGQDGTNLQSLRTDTTGNLGIYNKTTVGAFADGSLNTSAFQSNETGVAFVTIPYNYVFNGVSWDRLRGDAVSGIKASISGLTAASYGQIDVPVTEVAVPTLANSKTTCIKALAANSQKVYVGKTGVSATTGFELSAGDSIEVDTTDAVPWFMISASGTQRICYIVVS